MASLRSILGWFVAVFWLFVGASVSQADYDSSSCFREPRTLHTKPDVPCDLVKNTFCDTSGDNYPWTKLRKFVFENQGLIKRMYGYQTHYAILKDELLDALDDDRFYDPAEMYSPEAQAIPSENIRKVRNSVRSNAFRERYNEERNAPTNDNVFLGEWQAEGQIYFDDRAEKIPKESSSSNRRQNARHIDDGSSRSRDVKMMNFQHSGKRSIDSSLRSVQKDQHIGVDPSNKPKISGLDGVRTVQIKQGYSQSTVGGAATLGPEKLKTHSTESEPDTATASPGNGLETKNSTSESTSPTNLEDTSLFPDTPDSLRFSSPLQDNAETEKDSVSQEDKKKMDILFEELMGKADIITAKPPVVFQKPGAFFAGDDDDDFGTTERTLNVTAPRPPKNGVGENHSTPSIPTELPIPQQDEDYFTTEASSPENTWVSLEKQEAEVSDEGDTSEVITFDPEYRSSPTDETDVITETNVGDGDSVELKPEDISLQDNFKFPDEVPTNHESPTAVNTKNHRNSNTRRPALSQSRQPNKQKPENKWSGQDPTVETSPTSTSPVRVHSKVQSGNGGKTTSYRQPNDGQQAMWRRPQTEGEEPITTSTHPAPPTPSTIPTPLPRAPFKKGVNACPVETDVVAPYWANNTRGEVLALLNLSPFEQYVHWEKCRYEYRQMYCRQGCRCEQQYRLHRMLAFDPTNDCRGIFSDWFRFPSGCVCKCYDLPEQATRFPALYSRRPRGRTDADDEDAFDGGRQGRQEASEAVKNGDLSDVYFESEDALLPLHHAQDRIDDGYLENSDMLLHGSAATLHETRQRVNNIENNRIGSETAVLHGEPVSSLYSRAEASKIKPQIPLQSISPQRRPRPHVIGRRRQAGLPPPSQDHGYNLRFSPSARALHYSPLASLSRYNFQPSQQFLSRRQYYQNRRYRARNGWNPQASFPSNLSNPRFLKYVDNKSPRKLSVPPRVDDDSGSNNLNLNHLMQPAPTNSMISSMVAPQPESLDTRNVHSPQYFFNLTSHLIRTEQLDSKRSQSPGFKRREPRNIFGDDEP